jgi:hypothetical protein
VVELDRTCLGGKLCLALSYPFAGIYPCLPLSIATVPSQCQEMSLYLRHAIVGQGAGL